MLLKLKNRIVALFTDSRTSSALSAAATPTAKVAASSAKAAVVAGPANGLRVTKSPATLADQLKADLALRTALQERRLRAGTVAPAPQQGIQSAFRRPTARPAGASPYGSAPSQPVQPLYGVGETQRHTSHPDVSNGFDILAFTQMHSRPEQAVAEHYTPQPRAETEICRHEPSNSWCDTPSSSSSSSYDSGSSSSSSSSYDSSSDSGSSSFSSSD